MVWIIAYGIYIFFQILFGFKPTIYPLPGVAKIVVREIICISGATGGIFPVNLKISLALL